MGERRRREARQRGNAATAAVANVSLSGPTARKRLRLPFACHSITLPKYQSFILNPFRLSFRRAGITVRAGVSYDADGLNLNLDPRPSEIRHRDQSAAGIVTIVEKVLAHFQIYRRNGIL
jgi:hypothetical protein